MKIQKLVPRGFLRSYILKVLKSGHKHGYEIMKLMERETGWEPSPGAIYPILHKLKDKGLITEIKTRGERRIPYKLTKKGRVLANDIEKGIEEIRNRFWEFIGTMSQILEVEESELRRLMRRHENFRKGGFFLLPRRIRKPMIESRNLILKIAKDKSKYKKLERILEESCKRLEELEVE